jgi:protein-disulfide isomerase
MRIGPALWAVVAVTAAQALLGCRGTEAPAESAAGARVVSVAPVPGAFDAETLPVEEFAQRIDRASIPVVTSEQPSRGPVGAPVTIHVFSDFECPFCARAVPVLREVEAEFGGSVRIVWHDFPLPAHPHAELAAVAGALVYRERGGAAFWRFHDAVFDAAPDGLDEHLVRTLAKREGVDSPRIDAALPSGADGRLAADAKTAETAGVEGTPAFIVNDWMVTGVMPYPVFRALVARALSETKRH